MWIYAQDLVAVGRGKVLVAQGVVGLHAKCAGENVVGIRCGRAAEIGNGQLQFLLAQIELSARAQHARLFRRKRESGIHVRFCEVEILLMDIGAGTAAIGASEFWIDLDGVREIGDGLLVIVLQQHERVAHADEVFRDFIRRWRAFAFDKTRVNRFAFLVQAGQRR